MRFKLKRLLSLLMSIVFVVSLSINLNSVIANAADTPAADKYPEKISITTDIVYNRNSTTKATSATINVTAVSLGGYPSACIDYFNNVKVTDTTSITNGTKFSRTVTSNGSYKISIECSYGTAAKNIYVAVDGIGEYSDTTRPSISATVSNNSWTNASSLTVSATAKDSQSLTSSDNIFLDDGNLFAYSNFSTTNGWMGNMVACYVESCSESPTGKCLSINASQSGYGFFTRALNNTIKTNKAYLTFYAKCNKAGTFYAGLEGVQTSNFNVGTTWTKITIPLTKCKGKGGTIIIYPGGDRGKFSIYAPTLTDGWLPGGYIESTTEISEISGSSSVSTTLQVFDNGTYTLKARDKAGNVSTKEIKIQNIDRTAPTADIELSSSKYQSSVRIMLRNVSDDSSGISKVVDPEGNSMQESSFYGAYVYSVSENNKTYDFKIYDNAGNVTTKSINVTNLDKDNPQCVVTTSSASGWSNKDVEIEVTGTDWEMGSAWLGSGNLIKNSSFVNEFANWTKNGLTNFFFFDSNGHKAVTMNCTGQYQGIYQTISGTYKNAKLSVWVRAENSDAGKSIFFGIQNGKTKTVQLTSEWTRCDLDVGDVTNPIAIFYSVSSSVSFSMRDPMLTTDGVYSQQWIPNSAEINDLLDMSSLVKSVTNKFTVTQTGTYTAYSQDGAGNQVTQDVEVKIDKVAPTGDISYSNNPTNSSVCINIKNVSDEGGSGLSKVVGPDDSVIKQSEMTGYYSYYVKENGTYSFKIIDMAGNETIKTVTISNIDKVNPTLTNVSYDNNKVAAKGIITFSALDADSGIKSVKVNDVDLTLIESGNYSYEVNSNGSYKITVTDKAGNVITQTVTVSNIDLTKPTVNQVISEYSNGEAKVTIKATPNGKAKVKSYAYAYKSKVSTFALFSVLNDEITGEGDSITLDVNDESYVEGSFTTETNQVTTFTVDGYNVVVNEAIHEDNWLNKYIADQLGKDVEDLTIEDVESIKDVSVPNQGITDIPYTMKYMENLETIDLSDNDLTKIPSFVGDLENLKKLNVSGNLDLDQSTIPDLSEGLVLKPIYDESTTGSASGDVDVDVEQQNSIELVVSSNIVDFGEVTGLTESDMVEPTNFKIGVQSSKTYDVSIKATSDCIGQNDSNNVIPISKLKFNVEDGEFLEMSKNEILIAESQPATEGVRSLYKINFKMGKTLGYAKDDYKTSINVVAMQQ